MKILRWLAVLLPQLLVVLLLGSRFDLLFGWNNTDAATGTLMALFVLSPLVTGARLIAEWFAGNRGSRIVAAFLFAEALAINTYILSQLKMH
jgi:hypothetical protein